MIPDAGVVLDRRAEFGCSAEALWPWIVQLGKGRAGWYLPGWLEWLPNVNVEGQAAAAAPTVTQFDAAGYAADVSGEQMPTPDVANGADKDQKTTANPAALD